MTATTAMIAAAFLRWRPSLVAVEGSSMSPTLLPGDWALAVRTRGIRRGDVVVARHPGRPGYEIVKRIVGIPGDRVGTSVLGRDEWWLEGDHERGSTDSRQFGPVGRGDINARVLLVYGPKGHGRLL